MSLRVNFNILNQKGTPAFYSDVFANRPTFGYAGRVFISTDTGAIYEDTGSSWTLIADAGAGTTGTLQQVTTNGKTTDQGLVVTAGNVAIGTATAGAPLDIHGTGTIAQFNGTGTNNAYVFFQNAGTSKWRLGNNYNAGANSFDIYNNTLASVVASFNNAGSLLLNNLLYLKQGISYTAISGYSVIAGISNGIFFTNGNNYAATLSSLNLTGSRQYDLPDTNGTLALTSNLSSYLPLTGGVISGTLGVNCTPNSQFEVLGANGNALTDGIRVSRNTLQNTQYGVINYTSGILNITGVDTGSAGAIRFNTSNGTTTTERVRITSSNNGTLSIGTSEAAANSINFYGNYSNNQPGYAIYGSSANLLLEFNGNTKALYLGNLGTGTLYSNSGIISNTSPSDIRLKDNVQVLKYGLKDILKLRPVTYNWKKDEIKQGIQFGFIAQEVQEVIPEAIKEFGTDIKYLGLEKDAIYAALVNAIKELNDKIDNLKN